MCPTELCPIVQRLKDASWLTAITGVMLLLATGWAEAGETTFGPQRIIQQTDTDGAQSVIAADLDGDGDFDVLSASWYDDKIAWYENTDGMGAFGPQRVINTPDPDSDPDNATNGNANGALAVFAADLDGDGDLDVLSASFFDDKIAWYENTDGLGAFGPQQVITTSATGATSVFAADLDGDGDQDVLSASSGTHPDYFGKIAWYENTDEMGTFGPQQVITTSVLGALSVFAADLDGDGDIDVLSSSWLDDKIAWYENTDEMGAFGPQQVITTSADNAKSVFTADLDGDGDQDILWASTGTTPDFFGKIAWYENTDGKGDFRPQQTIMASADRAFSVFAADLDGDGDLDVLSASADDDKIAWYENTDAMGTFGPQQVITTSADGAVSVFAADLDGDGDFDVLSASFFDNKIAWYENLRLTPTPTPTPTPPMNAVPHWELYD